MELHFLLYISYRFPKVGNDVDATLHHRPTPDLVRGVVHSQEDGLYRTRKFVYSSNIPPK